MKKVLIIFILTLGIVLTSCTPAEEVICGPGTVEVEGKCEVDTLVCDTGYHKEDGACVVDEVTEECSTGYHEEDGDCVPDEEIEECNEGWHLEFGECVVDEIVELPDWFDGYELLSDPVGDKELKDFDFSESGFSIDVPANQRVGIQLTNVVLEPGYYYEVQFDYSSTVAGKGIFVQLQGHNDNVFTNPWTLTTEATETFSQILPMSAAAPYTNQGWLTIEITPSSVAAVVTIDNIELIETALPTCGENQVLQGIECIASNNGFLPNGTPTAWFDNWELLTVPAGSKDISDLNFTETGYTVYLAEGERSGIQLMDYVFESGYTYELSFDYTADVAGRMIWVQMEALGGHGFTNTNTWTIAGTESFSQSLVIPSTYNPTEPGWIKLECTPGGLDNITIDNITITKTPN